VDERPCYQRCDGDLHCLSTHLIPPNFHCDPSRCPPRGGPVGDGGRGRAADLSCIGPGHPAPVPSQPVFSPVHIPPNPTRGERSAIASPVPLEGIEALLKELARILLSETRPERVLSTIADRLRDLIPHDRLAIYRTDPSGRLRLPELV